MDKRIARAIELIRENLDRDLSLEELAAAANLSPSRFHQIFKDEMGTSPARYLKTQRFEHARHLLETSSLSVKEVRARVGVFDESHFSRDFRKAYGCAPAQFRAQHLTALASAPKEPNTLAPEQFRLKADSNGNGHGHEKVQRLHLATAQKNGDGVSNSTKVFDLLLKVSLIGPGTSRPKLALRAVRRGSRRPAGTKAPAAKRTYVLILRRHSSVAPPNQARRKTERPPIAIRRPPAPRRLLRPEIEVSASHLERIQNPIPLLLP